ncbi:hypothetical protein [Symbioplanes lichenis]|uniref:hypothetical protein n=1 Tax=Symbioplanes lichenis TaxID=1629072 RepID=UPI0027397F95|nr:hypothetical protein [Actinoplanes lichenis]
MDIATKQVDLAAPALVAALADFDRAAVRAALARQGVSLLDLRDAQRGITRHAMTAEQRAEYERANREAQAAAERLYS